jgi:hypothetical protein
MTKDEVIFDSKSYGSRHATRVRIVSTKLQPTSYAGKTGIVARVYDQGNIFVRFAVGRDRHIELPFGRFNLQVI